MSPTVKPWTDDAAEKVRRRLEARDLPLTPKHVLIEEDTDPLGDDSWRLVLVLPAPTGETWERGEVFTARRAAVDIFEELAHEAGRGLPGVTIAVVTTDEASESDTAAEDEPEEGEDPGRSA
ncbi:MAG: hypothetical protein QM677_05680 [Microbacterium sp.]